MKIFYLLTTYLLIAFLCISPVQAEDFWTSDIGKGIVNLGLRFLDNPGDFIFNLHSDNLDCTPVLKNRGGTIRTNFFPTFLPTTWLNLNLKAKVLPEGKYKRWVPQVDLLGQYGRMVAIDVLSQSLTQNSTETVKPALVDYAIGLIFTKSIEENTRLYAGVKYSNAGVNIKLSSPIEFGAFSMSELNVAVVDYFVITGIENKIKENKYVIAHLGYGLESRKIIARIGWYSKHLELGFNIYPEGLFVIHPFWAYHWYF